MWQRKPTQMLMLMWLAVRNKALLSLTQSLEASASILKLLQGQLTS